MENKKVVNRLFKIFMLILSTIYLALFIANNTGYYSFSLRNKKELTDKQIIKFEEDVKNGVEIDMNEYLALDTISYQNNISKLGYNISSLVENIVKVSVYKIFDFFSDTLEKG